MVARDPPDRTTIEWLHLACRDVDARRASIDDVKNAVPREYRLTAVFRVRTFHGCTGMWMIPIVLNALPAAEGGPMTCIDEH
ncbi:MAG: hypothetical protein ACYC0F_01990 [Rhodanobacter sp.]